MPIFLARAFYWIIGASIGSLIFRILSAIGLGVYTYKGLDVVLKKAFSQIQNYASALPVELLNIFAIAQVDTALTIIASAMLSSVAIKFAFGVFGVRA